MLRLIPAMFQAAGLIAASPQAVGDVPLYSGLRPPAAGPAQMNALGCVRILLVALGEEFWKAAVGAPSGAGVEDGAHPSAVNYAAAPPGASYSFPQDLPPGELVGALTGAFHPVASSRRDLAMELLHTMKVRHILLPFL